MYCFCSQFRFVPMFNIDLHVFCQSRPLINLPIFKTSGGNTGFAFYGTFYKTFYGLKLFKIPFKSYLKQLLKP